MTKMYFLSIEQWTPTPYTSKSLVLFNFKKLQFDAFLVAGESKVKPSVQPELGGKLSNDLKPVEDDIIK